MQKIFHIFLALLVALLCSLEFVPKALAAPSAALFGEAHYLLHIHKLDYRLDVYENGREEIIASYPIAVGKNPGDKDETGDMRTPCSWGRKATIPARYEGAGIGVPSSQAPFRIENIIPAQDWTHDFGDGKGEIAGAYGPWFLDMETGWVGIGIHGTHDPASIGTMASEGCIRLRNEDLEQLKNLICSYNGGVGTRVIITEE